MSKAPTTMREALAAQALEEVDGLLLRVESLVKDLSNAENNLALTRQSLDDAGDKYRLAVTAFTEQAKADLTEHIQRQGAIEIAKSVEEQRAAMQEAARLAFRAQASDDAGNLAKTLRDASSEFRRATWARLAENICIALFAALIAASTVYFLLRA